MTRPFITVILLCITQSVIGQSFTLDHQQPTGLRSGSISWGDINNDGNLDFIQTGNNIDAQSTTRVYLNNGATFDLLDANLPNIREGMTDWGDYDNDGDLDLLLAGVGSDGFSTRLYDNNNGNFDLNTTNSLIAVDRGSVEWGDYDNDGDLDILLCGQTAESGSITKIYNNTSGVFTEVENSIQGVSFGVASWFDFDDDGDLDVMISGYTGTAPTNGPKVTKLFENTGIAFSEVFPDTFEGLSESSMDFGDFDTDGDLDILLSGHTNTGDAFTEIYQNNGTSFDIVYEGSLPAIIEGQALWADTDNDGDLDAFISGNIITNNEKITELYTNTGIGFQLETTFTEAGQSSAEFVDYDNDGDLDLFISGQKNDLSIYSGIYTNNNTNVILTTNPNTKPSAPSNLVSQIEANGVVFQWDKSSDNETPQEALTYNLYLISTADTVVAASSLADGKRKLVDKGNVGHVNSYTLNKSLPRGTYSWSVQAIDNGFLASSFSNEGFFYINAVPTITGTNIELNTLEETPIIIEVSDLIIEDLDNEFPDDFTLTLFEGTNYSISGNEITPDSDFNGNLLVPVQVNDGLDNSNTFQLSVAVTPVNDLPIINGTISLLTIPEENELEINLTDLEVQDPDNSFPNDFTLTIIDGDNYSVTGNIITPVADFNGTLLVNVTVNDGIDDSNTTPIEVDVTPINDPPSIIGTNSALITPEETILTLSVSDLEIQDPDNLYPNDFTLNILEGDNYVVTENNITPTTDFNGTLFVNISVNDGMDESELAQIEVEVTPVNDPPQIYATQKILVTYKESPITIDINSLFVRDPDNDFPDDFSMTALEGSNYFISNTNEITPNDGYIGTLLVPVQINDGTDDSPPFIIQIEVITGLFARDRQPLLGIKSGSVDWGDYDSDGDLDILISGNQFNQKKTAIFQNDGLGNFSEVYTDQLPGVTRGNSKWVDLNNDGLLDIFLTGDNSDPLCSGCSSIARIYLNNGTDFILSFENQIPGYFQGMANFGDFDNDGDLDFVISGIGGGSRKTEIFINNGDEFLSSQNVSIPEVNFAKIDLGDFDNDGDLDILIVGSINQNGVNKAYSSIYLNDLGVFSEMANSGIIDLVGEAKWVDYNSDGWLDIVIAGQHDEEVFMGIYENINGVFEEVHQNYFPGIWLDPIVELVDYDNDGDLDILIAGSQTITDQNDTITKLYENTEEGFVEVTDLGFDIRGGFSKFGDSDNDGDLDLLVSTHPIVDVIKNITPNTNTPPSKPTNLSASAINGIVTLSWNASSDNETRQEGLSYNLHLRNETKTIISSNSLPNGKRMIVNRGNIGFSTSKTIELAPGDYFWKVQTLDNSYAGSEFSEETLLHINFPPLIEEFIPQRLFYEEEVISLSINDFIIDDPDNSSSDDFTITVLEGDNYSVSNNQIIPAIDFSGILNVAVIINDGSDDSNVFEFELEVTPLNDPPIITGTINTYTTQRETPISISINDLIVIDPDNQFPNDFTLLVQQGENYFVSNNEILPKENFIGSLTVPVQVSDGTDLSESFNLNIVVTDILGINLDSNSHNFSIFPNPVKNQLNITRQGSQEFYLVKVYSLDGSLIYSSKKINEENHSIDLTSLSNGTYIVQIFTHDETELLQILKN